MSGQQPDHEIDEVDGGDAFGPDLELVAHLLAAGQSHAEAGLAIGRSSKFVQRALVDVEGFKSRVLELKEQRAAEAAAALGALLPEAVDATRRALNAEKTADQLRAAALVFDQFRLFRSDSAAAERLKTLQEELDDLHEVVTGLSGAEDPAGDR